MLAVFPVLAALLVSAAADAASSPPNIVFIMADDLGIGDLGCYGQRRLLTPHIDRLANEGTRFDQCYAGSTVCAPSRCVLMTGLHCGHCRVRGNAGRPDAVPVIAGTQPGRIPLLPDDVTVAERLSEAGYATCWTGKWGLGEPGSTGEPYLHGFDVCLGFLNQDHALEYFSPFLYGNGQRVPLEGNAGGARVRYVSDVFTDTAIDFIRDSAERPFFLYLAYTTPHQPWDVPDVRPYDDPALGWTDPQRAYAAMVTRLDADVDRVLRTLTELDLDERTIVFFTSDNGAERGALELGFNSDLGLRGNKGEVYEGGIRVPMIVRWTGHVPAGRVDHTPWYFADFLPTALDLAGRGGSHACDGTSVLPTLLGQSQPELAERYLYWEVQPRMSQAARRGPWKLLRTGPDAPLELYHVVDDSLEERNLIDEQPEVAATMSAYLRTARTPTFYYGEAGIRGPSE